MDDTANAVIAIIMMLTGITTIITTTMEDIMAPITTGTMGITVTMADRIAADAVGGRAEANQNTC